MPAIDHTPDVQRVLSDWRGADGKVELITLMDTDEIYWFDSGVYRPGAEPLIKGWLQEQADQRPRDEDGPRGSLKQHYVSEVLAGVKRKTYVPREELNPPGKLNLRNGWFDLDELVFWEGHNSQILSTVQLPIAYDAGATCPAFLKFLEDVLPDETHRETVQRLFGYCLEPGNPYQVAFMLHGPGNNGKTTLLNVLVEVLGKENVSSETLQQFSDNRFSTAVLWGKLANVCADMPRNAVRYTGPFKEATGGDRMRGERKGKDPFTFENPSKLIFAANELPEVNDKTLAFWRRWKLIPFEVDLTGRADPRLPGRLRAELPGVLNWALEGLRRLREAHGFPHGGTADDLYERWKRHSDPLYWFVHERVRVNPKEWVEKDALYQAYADFCEEHSLAAKKRETVARDLPSHLPSVRSERKRQGDRRIHAWVGIDLLDVEVMEDGQTTIPEGAPGPGGPGGPGSPTPYVRARKTEVEEPGHLGPPGPLSPIPSLLPIIEEASRRLEWDQGLRALGEDAKVLWIAKDLMLAHQFDEAMRPSVEGAVREAVRQMKDNGHEAPPDSEGA